MKQIVVVFAIVMVVLAQRVQGQTPGKPVDQLAGQVTKSSEPVWTGKSWLSLGLGNGLKTGANFKYALERKGYALGKVATEMLMTVEGSTTPKTVELVAVSAASLGYLYGAKRTDIYDRAQGLGLELCSAEVGPQLRLIYTARQKLGERILIAMVAKSSFKESGWNDKLAVFGLWVEMEKDLNDRETGKKLLVLGADTRQEDFFDAEDLWVFCARR